LTRGALARTVSSGVQPEEVVALPQLSCTTFILAAARLTA
jgi:hypothetical protein